MGVPTPGQTIGPFFHRALRWACGAADARQLEAGSLVIEGTVEDGAGNPVPAWLVEAWVPQALAEETAAGCATPGFRRLLNDERGRFELRVPQPDPGQPAAFITLCGLGLTRHHFTAVFVELAGEVPSLLDAVPPERRSTLVAERVADERYRWVIRTQGERETVFLDYR